MLNWNCWPQKLRRRKTLKFLESAGECSRYQWMSKKKWWGTTWRKCRSFNGYASTRREWLKGMRSVITKKLPCKSIKYRNGSKMILWCSRGKGSCIVLWRWSMVPWVTPTALNLALCRRKVSSLSLRLVWSIPLRKLGGSILFLQVVKLLPQMQRAVLY